MNSVKCKGKGGKKRFDFKIYSLLFTLLTLSGCWDVDDINKRSVVLALGLDLTPEGRIRVSAQVPVIRDIYAPYISGGQAAPKPFQVVSGEADSSFGAVPEFQSKTIRSLFYGQIQAVIISADLAKRGLKPLVDFLERHPKIPPQAWVILSRGRAEDFLNTPLYSKEIPSLALQIFFHSMSKSDRAYPLQETEIVKAFTTGLEDAYMPLIAVDPAKREYNIDGLGVFHRDRLVGELSGAETRMFGFLSGRTGNAYPSIHLDNENKATFREVKASTKVKAIPKGQEIEFLFKTRARGYLVELTNAKANLSLKDIREIEQKTERAVKAEMLKTLRHLQELNSDILGLGELVRATQPEVWRRIDWEREFPRIGVKVDFKFNIERTGTYR
ncbi:MAG TPA: Ger(x)C family spore germination protein [Bacillota bacterium]|nr:Ger(x)C family spore germination protein [Bacillota bacterium]